MIDSTAINLGTGNLTLNGQLGVLLTKAARLTITARDVTFSATDVNDKDISASLFAVVATGNIMISTISLPAARVDLRAGGNITVDPRFRSAVGTPSITANVLFLQQAGAFAENLFLTTSRVSGAATFHITEAGVTQMIHSWMAGLGGTDFSAAWRGRRGAGLHHDGGGADAHQRRD